MTSPLEPTHEETKILALGGNRPFLSRSLARTAAALARSTSPATVSARCHACQPLRSTHPPLLHVLTCCHGARLGSCQRRNAGGLLVSTHAQSQEPEPLRGLACVAAGACTRSRGSLLCLPELLRLHLACGCLHRPLTICTGHAAVASAQAARCSHMPRHRPTDYSRP
jgi:hypothetical protein